MGTTKSNLFTDHQNQLATWAKALGHPARIAILQHLIEVDACINSDLVAEIGLAQPTISQHLKALKDAGIIKGTVEGVAMCYCIDKELVQAILQELSHMFSSSKTSCC